MFDPSNETEAGWDLDIRDDVIEECKTHGGIFSFFFSFYIFKYIKDAFMFMLTKPLHKEMCMSNVQLLQLPINRLRHFMDAGLPVCFLISHTI
jgi:hypothetical protein